MPQINILLSIHDMCQPIDATADALRTIQRKVEALKGLRRDGSQRNALLLLHL